MALDAIAKALLILYIFDCPQYANTFTWLRVFIIRRTIILHVAVDANPDISGRVIFIAVVLQLQNIISGNGNVIVLFKEFRIIEVPYYINYLM